MYYEEKTDFILVSWIPSGKIRPVHIHFFVLNFILRFYPSILLNRYREITCVVTPDVTPSIDYSINILWMGTTSFKPKWVVNFRICIFIMKTCLNLEWKEKRPRVLDYIYIDYGLVLQLGSVLWWRQRNFVLWRDHRYYPASIFFQN